MKCAIPDGSTHCQAHYRHVAECVEELIRTNNRLNRRCQQAESAARTKVDEVLRAGPSLGRALSAWAAGDYRRRLEDLQKRLPSGPLVQKACEKLGELASLALDNPKAIACPGQAEDCPCPRCKFDLVISVLRRLL